MKKFLSLVFIAIILVISFINLRYFFQPGLFKAHDIENHLARVANYYLAIKDGHFPVRWARNLNFKFGYPVYNYNYPLANILAYPLIVIGFSIQDSLKIILFMAYFGSGLFMYLWLKKLFSPLAALVGSVIYLCAPYQFSDLFVRGVVGENLSFALFPAVLYFLTNLVHKPTRIKFLLATISTVLFSLSHNLMVVVLTPIILIYFIYLTKKEKLKLINPAFWVITLGFLITSSFWIPAVLEQGYVNLEAFNYKTFYRDHFVNFKQLIYSPWQNGFSVAGDNDTMSFQIGLGQWLAVIISTVLFIKKSDKKKLHQLVIAGQLVFWFAVFLMLPLSQFVWRLFPYLGYLQFPWRLLSLATVAAAFLGAIVATRKKILGIVILVICLIYNQQFTKPFAWAIKPDMEYYDFLFTTTVWHEYNPKWFKESNIDNFTDRFIGESELTDIKEIEWKTGRHRYEIDSSQASDIIEHTAYFPGWQATVDGQPTTINYNNQQYPGLISLKIPSGHHLIETRFTEKTTARIIGDSLSAIALLGSIIYALIGFKRQWKKVPYNN
jgi:uncharacterized membrane protein